MMRDFGLDAQRLSAVIGLGMLVYGAGMVLAGRLADLWGTRTVLSLGVLLLSGSLALMAWTRSPQVFAFAFALPASLGFAATGHTAMTPILSRWFRRRRGLAMTFLSAGSMGGIAVMNPLATALIARFGWRAAYGILAAAILLLTLAGAWALLREPRDAASRREDVPDWRGALRTAPFWQLALGFFGCGFSMNLLGTHGVPMLEHHGFPPMLASAGVGLIGFVSMFGSLGLGALSDRWGRPPVLAAIYLGRALGFVALALVGQTWQLLVVAAFGGLVWAGSSALTSAITADLYGPRVVGTLFGWLFLAHQVGGALGTYLGGWGYGATGSYLLPFALTSAVLLLSAWVSVRLPHREPSFAASVAKA
jgi:MFS family permease